ncbi:hypothetical protein BTVI_91454 [Pitangus sulphuratus]|nr:hypothetical protein BTVI_91454 [Pitangus sulphuratus]
MVTSSCLAEQVQVLCDCPTFPNTLAKQVLKVELNNDEDGSSAIMEILLKSTRPTSCVKTASIIVSVEESLQEMQHSGERKQSRRFLEHVEENSLTELQTRIIREVPVDWRLVSVMPNYMKGWKKDLGNYRPVSLTHMLEKVMEQITLGGIMQHVEDNQGIRPSQYGLIKAGAA